MTDWNDLFVATAGASAALAGLIFVGISINLKTIMEYPALINRAAVSLALLLAILTVSVLLLVPQSTTGIGIELLVFGIFFWLFITIIDFKSYKKTQTEYRRSALWAMIFDQFALLPYAIAGIGLLTAGRHGVYWLLPAILVSFVKSVFDAWVLLIEVNR